MPGGLGEPDDTTNGKPGASQASFVKAPRSGARCPPGSQQQRSWAGGRDRNTPRRNIPPALTRFPSPRSCRDLRSSSADRPSPACGRGDVGEGGRRGRRPHRPAPRRSLAGRSRTARPLPHRRPLVDGRTHRAHLLRAALRKRPRHRRLPRRRLRCLVRAALWVTAQRQCRGSVIHPPNALVGIGL